MQVNRRWAIGSIVGGIIGLFGLRLEAKHPKKNRLILELGSIAISPDKKVDPIHNTLKKYDICFQRVTLEADLDIVTAEPFTNIVTKNEGIDIRLGFDMKYATIDQFIERCLFLNDQQLKYFIYIVGLNGKSNILASEQPYYIMSNSKQPCRTEYLKGYIV